jgi:hypothetical protein
MRKPVQGVKWLQTEHRLVVRSPAGGLSARYDTKTKRMHVSVYDEQGKLIGRTTPAPNDIAGEGWRNQILGVSRSKRAGRLTWEFHAHKGPLVGSPHSPQAHDVLKTIVENAKKVKQAGLWDKLETRRTFNAG